MIQISATAPTWDLKRGKRKLYTWLRALAESHQIQIAQLNYVLMGDEELLTVNQAYLNHDTLTDIITFPLHEAGEPVIGEIYISIDRVRENAKTYGVPFEEELRRVLAHGLLHLAGFKDKTNAEAATMRQAEEAALTLWQNLQNSQI